VAVIDWNRETFLFTASIVYAVLGGALLLLAFKVFDWITPLDLSQAILRDHNVAAAIATAGFLIALALIIAAAIN
jgi:uncharacterized membrane protein YjfL (UPF0719 family)